MHLTYADTSPWHYSCLVILRRRNYVSAEINTVSKIIDLRRKHCLLDLFPIFLVFYMFWFKILFCCFVPGLVGNS